MKIVKYICDSCGCDDHDSPAPSKDCIEALKMKIKDAEINQQYRDAFKQKPIEDRLPYFHPNPNDIVYLNEK